MTKYRIVISEERVVPVTEREWVKLADTGGDDDGAKYGWAEHPDEETQKGNILDLTLDHLNLQEIIDAAMRVSS